MGIFKSCRSCTERTPGCHGKCEKYIKERADFDKVKENQKEKDLEYRSYRRESMAKTMAAKAMEKKKKRSYPGMGGY